jgi:ribosomal protein S12 methylthiotransferase accessory factor
MRWVEGWSLRDDARRFVPLMCTHLYVDGWPAERIWFPISTGTAAHTDLGLALVNAVSEAIERDAIAITWLARLPLARIELPETLPAELEPNVGRLRRSQVRQIFFDATTDLGVPTIYSLQLTERHPRLGQYVSCSTELDPWTAIAKAVREAAPARTVLQMPRAVPEEVADFVDLESGAIHLGRPERRDAFDFLLESPRRVALDELERPEVPADSWGQLAWLLECLRPLGTDVVVVDLTPGELREAGLHVVKVVVPGLMPMSSMHRARFLGHPRLYQAARDLGQPIAENDVNPDPQPFA